MAISLTERSILNFFTCQKVEISGTIKRKMAVYMKKQGENLHDKKADQNLTFLKCKTNFHLNKGNFFVDSRLYNGTI